jgi:hypothetical protein
MSYETQLKAAFDAARNHILAGNSWKVAVDSASEVFDVNQYDLENTVRVADIVKDIHQANPAAAKTLAEKIAQSTRPAVDSDLVCFVFEDKTEIEL